MMKCPKCGRINLRVTDTRDSVTRKGWMRKRECQTCGYSFTTVERCSLTVQEISEVRFNIKEHNRREKIARIKEQAKKMNIKLADD